MKNVLIILIGCLGILYASRFAFLFWFQSKNYVTMTQKQRVKYRKVVWLFPQAVTFNFLDKNPIFEIWMMRIASLLMIAFCILWVIAGIHGPFTVVY